MKSTTTTALLCFLCLESTFAQPHFERPEEINAKSIAVNTNIFAGPVGRTISSPCGPGSGVSRHHDVPCDEDVESKGDDSESISIRQTPRETAPPVTTPPAPPVTPPLESCESDNGVYGLVEGVETFIAYDYEMQTIADNTDPTRISSDVLPKLEKAIVDSILHDLFPQKCASTAIGKRTLIEGIDIIGVSMNPLDFVTDSTCKFLTPEDSFQQCLVLKGGMTIYVAEGEDEEFIAAETEKIGEVIKMNMNAGNYDNAHVDIIDLLYLDKMNPIESNVDNGEDGDLTQTRNRNSLRVGLFVGIGALGAVLAGVIFRLSRRGRNGDEDTELQSGGPETYLDVEARPSFA